MTLSLHHYHSVSLSTSISLSLYLSDFVSVSLFLCVSPISVTDCVSSLCPCLFLQSLSPVPVFSLRLCLYVSVSPSLSLRLCIYVSAIMPMPLCLCLGPYVSVFKSLSLRRCLYFMSLRICLYISISTSLSPCLCLRLCTPSFSLFLSVSSFWLYHVSVSISVCLCHRLFWDKGIFVLLQKLFDTYIFIFCCNKISCVQHASSNRKILRKSLVRNKFFQCNFQTATASLVF